MTARVHTAFVALACAILLTGCAHTNCPCGQHGHNHSDGGTPGVVIDNLMTAPLEGADGLEGQVTFVEIPANASLPKHWHPGEEFAYVLEGSITLWQDGMGEKTYGKGETGGVGLKKIHSAKAGPDGVKLIVFRVHEVGQPERVLVE